MKHHKITRRLGLFLLIVMVIGWGSRLLVSEDNSPPDSLNPTHERRPLRPASDNKMGIHVLMDDGRSAWPQSYWHSHLWYARGLVGRWGYVTQVIRADNLQPAYWQYFLDLCADLHLVPIFRLATTFDRRNGWWRAPLTDSDGRYTTIAQTYADFLAALQWPTPDKYIIIGNEPNSGHEWSGTPDPAAYARFLRDVAVILHASDPDIRILNGAVDLFAPHTHGVPFSDGISLMDAESFLDGMIAAVPDVFSHLDAWASHPYPVGAFIEPPWEQTYHFDRIHGAVNPKAQTPPNGVYNRGINGYEWELWKLSTYGIDDLPVMITETGWRWNQGQENSSYPDAETIALYMDLAFWGNDGRYPDLPRSGWRAWQDDARVIAVTPFALNGVPHEWGGMNWLWMDNKGQIIKPMPVYTRLKSRGVEYR